MPENKNNKLLNRFVTYCRQNPDMRFWQALRNWAKVDKIMIQQYGEDAEPVDTFYFETNPIPHGEESK